MIRRLFTAVPSTGNEKPRPHRGAAMASIFMGIFAWAVVIGRPRSLLRSGVVFLTIYILAICALIVGVIASRLNKQFITWRILSDVGLILGLILWFLGVVVLALKSLQHIGLI